MVIKNVAFFVVGCVAIGNGARPVLRALGVSFADDFDGDAADAEVALCGLEEADIVAAAAVIEGAGELEGAIVLIAVALGEGTGLLAARLGFADGFAVTVAIDGGTAGLGVGVRAGVVSAPGTMPEVNGTGVE